MEKKELQEKSKVILTSLVDFFWVYFDEKTSKTIKNHPEQAILLLKNAVQESNMNKRRLTIFSEALKLAVDLQEIQDQLKPLRKDKSIKDESKVT